MVCFYTIDIRYQTPVECPVFNFFFFRDDLVGWLRARLASTARKIRLSGWTTTRRPRDRCTAPLCRRTSPPTQNFLRARARSVPGERIFRRIFSKTRSEGVLFWFGWCFCSDGFLKGYVGLKNTWYVFCLCGIFSVFSSLGAS